MRVAARRDGDQLVIEVTDEGPGFAANGTSPRVGVGLANVRERLALLYGAAGVLDCADRPEGGGRVRVRLPWRTAGAEEVRA